MPARSGLPKDVIDRVASFRPRSLNERVTKANLLELLRLYAVAGNMINPVFRPEDIANLHPLILHRRAEAADP